MTEPADDVSRPSSADRAACAATADEDRSGSGAPAVCAACGQRAETPPPTWTLQVGPAGRQWLCGTCTRDNLRSIEARLDEAWW